MGECDRDLRTIRIEYLSCGCVRFRDEFSPDWTNGSACPGCGQDAQSLFFERRHVWKTER